MDALNLIFGIAVALVSFLSGFGVAMLNTQKPVQILLVVDQELLEKLKDD
jgi:hypothetical protein